MWTLVVALLLAFVMPAMAYIPLVQGARGAPLQKNGKPPSPKPRSARSSRQAVMSVDDEFGCVKCTKAPQRDALVRTAFTLMPITADAATASSRQSGKKSRRVPLDEASRRQGRFRAPFAWPHQLICAQHLRGVRHRLCAVRTRVGRKIGSVGSECQNPPSGTPFYRVAHFPMASGFFGVSFAWLMCNLPEAPKRGEDARTRDTPNHTRGGNFRIW